MYSSPSFKKIFFALLGLVILSLGIFIYFSGIQKDNDQTLTVLIVALIGVSFLINVLTISSLKFKKNRKGWILLIFGLLYFSFLYQLTTLNIITAYFFLSIVLLLLLDVFPISSSLKYFNIGMLTTLSAFIYFPIVIFILFFLLITILYYEERINISQYIAGVVVTLILIVEVVYLTGFMPYLIEWSHNLTIPAFHYQSQLPILIILGIIFLYGIINQYSNTNIKDNLEVAGKHFILLFYLLLWTLIYAFFMGENYSLLIFVSMPMSLIVSRSL